MTTVYYAFAAAWILYCWRVAGPVGLVGACVMTGLNEWVRRTGGYT